MSAGSAGRRDDGQFLSGFSPRSERPTMSRVAWRPSSAAGVAGRAAHRQRLGRLRSRRTAEPALALLAADRAVGPDGKPPTRVLVDTGPDMRAQLLAADVDHVDAVLYTHAHADHIHGIDDLRAFWLNTKRLRRRLRRRRRPRAARSRPSAIASGRRPAAPIRRSSSINRIAAGDAVHDRRRRRRRSTSLPFRQQPRRHRLARLPLRRPGIFLRRQRRCRPTTLRQRSAGLDVWIVDALRYEPHPSHFSVAEALAWIEQLEAAAGDPHAHALRTSTTPR